ncbi:MAG: SpoVG family protein [Oscillospiraceae bacterium]|nr:SpoVG family protein [Oscillospiraceae bacterium]
MANLTLHNTDEKTGEVLGTVNCEIRAYPIAEPKGKTKGFASITVDGIFGAHGISIIEGPKGLFVSMPQTKDGKGEYRDLFHPVIKGGREALQTAVLTEFGAALDAMVTQKESTLQKMRDAAAAAKSAPAATKEPKEKGAKKNTGPEH